MFFVFGVERLAGAEVVLSDVQPSVLVHGGGADVYIARDGSARRVDDVGDLVAPGTDRSIVGNINHPVEGATLERREHGRAVVTVGAQFLDAVGEGARRSSPVK